MLTGIFTFAIIFSIVGAILYGKRLVKNEKIDAVFGNPEREKVEFTGSLLDQVFYYYHGFIFLGI